MKRTLALLLTLALFATLFAGGVTALADDQYTQLESLTVNYKEQPLGIETDNIRFSWKMNSNIIGQEQAAYQLVVREESADGTVIWDSGKVTSSTSVAISYGGSALKAETRYNWSVTVDTTMGDTCSASSWFETGTDWDMSGAEWITIEGFLSDDPYEGRRATYGTYSEENMNALMFRTEQELTGTDIASARLYISGVGSYEAYINGEIVQGDRPMAFGPGWTDYLSYVNYQTYDVAEYIDGDKITLGAIVGSGFYGGNNGGSGASGVFTNTDNGETDRVERGLLAKLVIKYSDGSTQEIVSSADGWKVNSRTPILADGIRSTSAETTYPGGHYDARIAKEFEGWNDVDYNPGATESDWKSAVELIYAGVEIAGDSGVIYEYTKLPWITAYSYNPSTDIIEGWKDGGPSTYRTGTVDEEKMVYYEQGDTITIKDGEVLVLDFGQNAAALPEFTVSGDAGTLLWMKNGENISDGNSTITTITAGWEPTGVSIPKYAVNFEGGAGGYRSFQYVLSGDGMEHYKVNTHFVGYRYLALTAQGGDVTLYGIESVVVSSVGEEAGVVETSNAAVNQFVQNSKWSQIGNFISAPTDCPTREYNGWTGDIQVYVDTAFYHFESTGIIGQFIEIMQEGLKRVGNYNSTMPSTVATEDGGTSSPGWTDAGVIVPWIYYQQTGDTSLLLKYWTEMCTYTDTLNAKGQYGDTWVSAYSTTSNDGTAWGDHLGVYIPTGQFTATVYHLYDNMLMAEMAEVLGMSDDAAKYSAKAENIRTYMIDRYLMSDGYLISGRVDDVQGSAGYPWAPYTKVDNAQTALAWMLKLGIYDTDEQRDTMAANLAKSIANAEGTVNEGLGENTIAAGFLGVHVLLPMLSQFGENSTAYALMTNTEPNSFLYAIVAPPEPATTIWEEWVIWGSSDEQGWGKGSQNHYAYGASAEWLYKYVLGIERDEATPAYKEFVLQPVADSALDYAKGSYDSYYGRIESSWTAVDGVMDSYNCVVPANTKATLYLPVAGAEYAGDLSGVEYIGNTTHNGIETAEFELASGGYSFTMNNGTIDVNYASGYDTISGN